MSRRHLLILIFFFVSAVIVFVGESCFPKKEKLCTIQLAAKDIKLRQDGADRMTDSFEFSVIGRESSPRCNIHWESLSYSAYAFKKCPAWENSLVTNTFRLFFSRPIAIGIDTLAAGADVFGHDFFKANLAVEQQKGRCGYVEFVIRLDSTQYKKLSFEDGEYTGTFSCSTSDQRELSASHSFVFSE